MSNEQTSDIKQILVIEPEFDGISLEKYLIYHLRYSRRMLTRLKQSPEYVLRNGVHINLPEAVHAGDVIELTVKEVTYTLPGIAGSVPIVYEDEDIILYRKPIDMPIHPSRNHLTDTLANVFTADMQAKGLSLPFRVLNRLDRDTSGLCLCAKNATAANHLSKQQQDGTLQKEYTAVLCGRLPCHSGIIEAPIARPDPFYIERMVRADGQYAKTAFEVLAQNDKYTMVRVYLYTGRTHQIRVHFSTIGYPLAGDTMYSAGKCTDKDLSAHALCCTSLRFLHPTSGESLVFSIDPRPEMSALTAGDESCIYR